MMGSRHLSSYFPSYHFHFIYLFHCPIVVYISTLSDRKVPILFFLDILSGKVWFVLVSLSIYSFGHPVSFWGLSCDFRIFHISGSLSLPTRQSPLQQNKMNPMETGTQMDLAELTRSRPGNYSALLNDILASPAEVPSPLLASDDFPLPASTTNWSIDQRFADLEAQLFERQEKISETLRLMTWALDMISKSVHVKQQAPTVTPGRGTTLCRTVRFNERSHCVERLGFNE